MSERQKTAPQARGRRFCHVFKVPHYVYKYAPNRLSFRAQSKNFVIQSASEESRGNETTNFFCARAAIIHYSLLIIHSKSIFSAAVLLTYGRFRFIINKIEE